MQKKNEEWKKILTPEEYYILREKGTERPFSGKYYYNREQGIYCCAACDHPVFSSEEKYESGTGWPSFFAPYEKGSLGQSIDKSLGMIRKEVHCKKCGGHLGHVFDDGPQPTGKRYCINSLAMKFKPGAKE